MRALPATALLLVLTACGTTAGSGERACTEIGTPVGIGLEISRAQAEADTASVEACWDQTCRTVAVELRASTAATRSTCQGEVCSAETVPTGGKNGFAAIEGLPREPVRVTLTLRDGGRAVLERTATVTPTLLYPNGVECPGGGPQARLVVDAKGALTQR